MGYVGLIQNRFSCSIFISEAKEKTHSTQNFMHYKGLKIEFLYFHFWTIFKSMFEVFADVSTIYFTALWWIMNVWSSFEPLKTQLLGICILIIFLIWKWIKYIFVLICIKKVPGVRSIAMKSIRTTIGTPRITRLRLSRSNYLWPRLD